MNETRKNKLKNHRRESTSNYDSTNDFLKVAISDLTGNLTLLDTKISLIMATVGAVIGLVVACKSNVLKALPFLRRFLCI